MSDTITQQQRIRGKLRISSKQCILRGYVLQFIVSREQARRHIMPFLFYLFRTHYSGRIAIIDIRLRHEREGVFNVPRCAGIDNPTVWHHFYILKFLIDRFCPFTLRFACPVQPVNNIVCEDVVHMFTGQGAS